MISVTIGKPDAKLEAHWAHLAPFAHNVFMHPTALRAASATIPAIYVLLAWKLSVEPAKLVGLWAMQGKQLLCWPFLEALPFNYAFLSTPVLHPDYAHEAMPALLAAVTRKRGLPTTLVLRDLDGDGREHSAIMEALAGHPQVCFRIDQRPIATREAGLKRSGSTRKKLRQDWNRLAATAAVEIVNERDPAGVGTAFESFLEIELGSWKGAGGTAILSNPADTAFARRLIGDMAALGDASVALLKLDGKPVAAQVLLYQGRTAFTWKTSFDPDYARYSPGTLLVDRVTTDLIDQGVVDAIDSCARGDSFMAQLWTGRKPTVDMVVSASLKASPSFLAVAGYLRGRETFKALRDRLRRRRARGGSSKAAASAPKPVSAPATGAAAAQPKRLAASAPKPTADRAA
jgi:CelD/BcsL family acetyltransferase involved in cellulose biosynthesis